MTAEEPKAILGLDVGSKRIGIAVATAEARLPGPLCTLENTAAFWDKLAVLVQEHGVEALVVGLPRSLEGNDTAQTREARTFMARLRANTGLPVYEQDEAATSIQAEAELTSRGRPYRRGDIDALAATYILDDFLQSQRSSGA
ncbi:MAG TPA: Holliday junction resolvase RuvX [Candidatus Saccharimonadales bacterium]